MISLFNFGAYLNHLKVTKFLNAIKPTLEENFAQVGVKKDQLALKDSAQLFTSYATGRLNIDGFYARFSLIARQNIVVHVVEWALGTFTESIPVPTDEVEITVKLSDAEKLNKYIFALVNKDGMSKARENNYYLSLTKTTESSAIPHQYVFMSESAELNDNLVSEELKQALKESDSFLKYIAITDLPSEKPLSEEEFISVPKIKMVLSLKTDSKSLASANALVREVIVLADKIFKFQLKADQQKKINNVRINELNKIKKAIADAKAEELREMKLEAERKARRESTLSPEEQDKLDQKKKEKKERRAMKKMSKRM